MADEEDPSKIVKEVVNSIKSSGIFDKFRKECLEELEGAEAYSQMKRRMSNHVTSFLSKQRYTNTTSKNALRDGLRKHINQSEVLQNGVHRVVDQILMQYGPVISKHIDEVVDKYFTPKLESQEEGTKTTDKEIKTEESSAQPGTSHDSSVHTPHLPVKELPLKTKKEGEVPSKSINSDSTKSPTSAISVVSTSISTAFVASPLSTVAPVSPAIASAAGSSAIAGCTDSVLEDSVTTDSPDTIPAVSVELPVTSQIEESISTPISVVSDSKSAEKLGDEAPSNTIHEDVKNTDVDEIVHEEIKEEIKEGNESDTHVSDETDASAIHLSHHSDKKDEAGDNSNAPSGSPADVIETPAEPTVDEVTEEKLDIVPVSAEDQTGKGEILVAIDFEPDVAPVKDEERNSDLPADDSKEDIPSVHKLLVTEAADEKLPEASVEKSDDLPCDVEESKTPIENTVALSSTEEISDDVDKEAHTKNIPITRNRSKSLSATDDIKPADKKQVEAKVEPTLSRSKRRKTIPTKSIIKEAPPPGRPKRKVSESNTEELDISTNRSGKRRKSTAAASLADDTQRSNAKRPRRNIRPKQCYSP